MYDSEIDAYRYFTNIVLDSPYVKGDYFISSIKFSNIESGETQETQCSSLDCKNEIEELERMLNDNQKLKYSIEISDVLTGEKISIDYKEQDLVKYFDSLDDANTFAKEYIPEYLDDYKFIGNEVVPVNVSIPVLKTYLELKEKDTFASEEEAKTMLAEFKREYPNAVGGIDKINNGSSTENGTLEFSNKKDAEDKIASITKDTELEKTSATLREETKTVGKEDIYGEYSTKEEAIATVNELKNNGYIVNENIEENAGGITGNVLSGISRPSSSRYELSIDETNFVLIKQGSGHYAVWTEYELTDGEKDTFVKTYNLVNSGSSKFDGSTTNISKDDITWIYGFKAHDLSNIGPNWGTYTFTKDTNNIILTCNADKVSHIIQGYATPKLKYILTGYKYKEEKVWYVDYTRTIYSFLYKINASVLVDESVLKYKVLSNYEKLVKEAMLNYSIDTTTYYFKYKLSYEKYILLPIDISNVEWIIEECENIYGIGGSVEELPPQTGIEYNIFIRNLLIILLVVLLSRNIYIFKNI